MGVDISIDLNAALEKHKENKVYNKDTYSELLSKYEEALKYIKILEDDIVALKKKAIPTTEEIESIKAVLGLFGIDRLDSDGIQKFIQIKDVIKNIN